MYTSLDILTNIPGKAMSKIKPNKIYNEDKYDISCKPIEWIIPPDQINTLALIKA